MRPLTRLPLFLRPLLTLPQALPTPLSRTLHTTPPLHKKKRAPIQRDPQARFAEDDLNQDSLSNKSYSYLADRTLDTFFDNVELASEADRPELDIESAVSTHPSTTLPAR